MAETSLVGVIKSSWRTIMIERIGFRKRVVATLIDSLFLSCGLLLITFLTFVVVGASAQTIVEGHSQRLDQANLAEFPVLAQTLMAGINSVYIASVIWGLAYGLCEGITGASPAKMLLGIRIGNEDGTVADGNTLLKRFALKQAPQPFFLLANLAGLFFLNLVGYLIFIVIQFGCLRALGKSRQALHDQIAKTAVFRADELRYEFGS